MTMPTNKTSCATCRKEKVAYKCEGCSRHFCIKDLNAHHELISKELDGIEDKRNILRKIFTDQKGNIEQHSLMKQINQWEHDAIEKIQQTAKECRVLLSKNINRHLNEIEEQLNQFTKQVEQIKDENNVNEIILNEFKHLSIKLEEDLHHPANISIEYHSSSFIPRISVRISNSCHDSHGLNLTCRPTDPLFSVEQPRRDCPGRKTDSSNIKSNKNTI